MASRDKLDRPASDPPAEPYRRPQRTDPGLGDGTAVRGPESVRNQPVVCPPPVSPSPSESMRAAAPVSVTSPLAVGAPSGRTPVAAEAASPVDDLVAALGAQPKPVLPRRRGAAAPLPAARRHEPTVLIAPPSDAARIFKWSLAGIAVAALIMVAALALRHDEPAAERTELAPPATFPATKPPVPVPVAVPTPTAVSTARVSPPEPTPAPRATEAISRPPPARASASKAPPRAPRSEPSAGRNEPKPSVPGLEDLKSHY